MADGLELVHELGIREEVGHDAERQPAEVLIEAGDDDAHTAVCERQRRIDDATVEELHLVDADHIVAGAAGNELGHAFDGNGPHPRARM